MTTVGRLAKKHGLSRSTLLYYHRLGLLSPTGHRQGLYRRYTDADDARLARIVRFKSAGLSLAEIRTLLDAAEEDTVTRILEGRLMAMCEEIERIKTGRLLTARLLGTHRTCHQEEMTKKTWTATLENAGFTEADMHRWHREFEIADPEGHDAFLKGLNIDDEEIREIRDWALSDPV